MAAASAAFTPDRALCPTRRRAQLLPSVSAVTDGTMTPLAARGELRLPPLFALALTGLCIGLILSLALSPGGLPLALLVVAGVAVIAARPWAYRRRRLDRVHAEVAASRPLRDVAAAIDEVRRTHPYIPLG